MNRNSELSVFRAQCVCWVLVVIAFIGSLTLPHVHSVLFYSAPPDPELFTAIAKTLLKPEPAEQFTFFTLVVVLTSVAFAMAFIQQSDYLPPLWARAGLIIVGLINLAVLLNVSDLAATLIGSTSQPAAITYLSQAIALVAALIFTIARVDIPKLGSRSAAVLFLAALCFQIAALRIVDFKSASTTPTWWGHVDAALYATGQVVAGKTLLVDLPSQYGMYPELFAPVLRLVGPSILSISILFAVMQAISLLCVYWVMSQLIRNQTLLLASGLAVLLVTFCTTIFMMGWTEERYFQYWPVRFFFPAISLASFYVYAKSLPKIKYAAVCSALSSLAVIWNSDTGIFVSASFGAFLAFKAVAQWVNRRPVSHYIVAFAIHLSTQVVAIALFLVAISVKAGGQSLRYEWLFEYQRIFFKAGVAMLPLPGWPHPWIAVAVLYFAGITWAFHSWKMQISETKANVVFYLSVLGVGLFVYYLGRSHDLNVINVCWPAVVLLAIATDGILGAHRRQLLPACYLPIATCGASVLFLFAGAFLWAVPSMAKMLTRSTSPTPIVQSEMSLIRRHSSPGDECMILALRQGIYSIEANLASPIKGPGLSENLLKADQEKAAAQILAGQIQCLFLGVGADSASPIYAPFVPAIEARYRVVDTNPERTMLFMRPKADELGGQR